MFIDSAGILIVAFLVPIILFLIKAIIELFSSLRIRSNVAGYYFDIYCENCEQIENRYFVRGTDIEKALKDGDFTCHNCGSNRLRKARDEDYEVPDSETG